MSVEIERKFLIKKIPENLENYKSEKISQGYLVVSEDIEVRIRKKGKNFYLTVKSGGDLIRDEIEIELQEKQFNTLWPLTEEKRIVKKRYYIPYENHLIELDIYSDQLKGLIVGEVEFKSEKQSEQFSPPDWFGEEITADKRYKNKNLFLNNPFIL